jgi:hypothetical protein
LGFSFFSPESKLKYFFEQNERMRNWIKITQVGFPAVRRRLACCTAWVKRWSEAMDFPQTIFKANILQNYDFLLRFKSEAKISKKFTQNYDLVLRFKSEAKFSRNSRKKI